jgi:hypothetical protein
VLFQVRYLDFTKSIINSHKEKTMAQISDGRAVSGSVAVEQITKAQRVCLAPRGFAFSASGITGTMAAALSSGGAVFTMRNDLGSSKRAFIERIRLQYVSLVSYTTPVTAGRRLHLVRSTSSSANPSGGTAIVPVAKDSTDDNSECSTAGGGDTRIATTAALTVTGTTWDTNVIKTIPLVHVGTSGNFAEFLIDCASSENAPIILEPGQALGLVAGQNFDAAGTWQLAVNVDWHEAVLWDAASSE